MIKRFLLLALTAITMIGTANAQTDFSSEGVTLESFANYMDTAHNYDPMVKVFYSNLINNPTHSYRIEHLDLGFNGCTGRVDEQVILANGSKRNNVFIFNEQGLLTRSAIQGSKGKVTEVNYTYAFDAKRGYSLKESKSKNVVTKYAPIFSDNGYRTSVKGSNGSRQDYTFNDRGQLTKLVIKPVKGDKRTLVYQGGYVIREEVGDRVFHYHYDFDTATGKKFLIAIKEVKGEEVVRERTFKYEIDTHGRYTRVDITAGGKPQMTIIRSYSN